MLTTPLPRTSPLPPRPAPHPLLQYLTPLFSRHLSVLVTDCMSVFPLPQNTRILWTTSFCNLDIIYVIVRSCRRKESFFKYIFCRIIIFNRWWHFCLGGTIICLSCLFLLFGIPGFVIQISLIIQAVSPCNVCKNQLQPFNSGFDSQ